MINKHILDESILRVGRVLSVEGRIVKVSVDRRKNTSNLIYKGGVLKNVSVGKYIKITKGFINIVGKVEGEYIEDNKLYYEKKYASLQDKVVRTLKVSLLGFFEGDKFRRGIKELPLIDNECYLLEKKEFEKVHNFVSSKDYALKIGKLSLEKGQEISIGVNSLFASHIGIFGNTGSGKSYTLAKLYRELFLVFRDYKRFRKNAQFLIIDFNGEYVGDDKNVIIEEDYKNVLELTTKNDGGDKIKISESDILDPQFWAVFFNATEKTQKPFLRRALESNYLANCLQDETTFRNAIYDKIFEIIKGTTTGVDKTLAVDFLNDLKKCLGTRILIGIDDVIKHYDEKLVFMGGNLNKFKYEDKFFDEVDRGTLINSNFSDFKIEFSKISKIQKVCLRIIFQYYRDIIKGYSNKEHLAPLMSRIDKRLIELSRVIEVKDETNDKNITIVSLKDVNLRVRKILPLLLCKHLYDKKKRANDSSKFLNIIIDEAHNILSYYSERETEQWKDYRLETFEEIIKEGRKFGVFLTVVSQRPADISSTIISQIHNFFLHRLINENDISAVERNISYLDKASFEYLHILPIGTCIFAGVAAQVPVIIDINPIEKKYEPDNKTINLLKHWK